MQASGRDQRNRTRGRQGTNRLIGLTLPAAAVAGAAALLVVAIAEMGPIQVEPPEWQTGGNRDPGPAPTIGPMAEEPAFDEDEFPDVESLPDFDLPGQAIFIALLVLIAIAVVMLVRRLPRGMLNRRRSAVVGGEVDTLPDHTEGLRDAAESAGAALRRTGTGTDAIIAAWLALEAAAADSGDARDPAQTPSEFTTHLLRRHHADPAATTLLRDLYHRARFSTHPDVRAEDIDAAHAALDTIVQTLDAPDRPGRPQAGAS